MSFPAPVTVVSGSTDPAAPLVVLCHGISEDETMFDHVVPHLPASVAVVRMRGPVSAGRGYNWFERREGRIWQPSLEQVMDWFEEWLESVAPAGRPVIPIGFSAGSAFASALLIRRPERYVGAGVLAGAIPISNMPDAAVPGRFIGKRVFLAISEQDRIIREEYTRDTWDYLLQESAAAVTARVDPGGHEVTEATAKALGVWLAGVVSALEPATAGRATPEWSALPQGLPRRLGNRPLVTWAPPQQQWSDQALDAVNDEVAARVASLPGVRLVEVGDDVRGQVSVRVDGAEFARLTALHDTSVRVVLPPALARDVVVQGWGQVLATPSQALVLVYGPRSKGEIDVVSGIVAEAHARR
ncbi:alpha/beta hydrolase [Nocardioides alcanivorans]|uniref:alpha/beta hydrolase n=1 Tax=Nocardioides alcanivorans TaxID=2897352 RepID=UPI001F31E2F8|nr:luciferase family protein [Nocardioides alcanivorans]